MDSGLQILHWLHGQSPGLQTQTGVIPLVFLFLGLSNYIFLQVSCLPVATVNYSASSCVRQLNKYFLIIA